MPITVTDAKARLESEGLFVSNRNGDSLWIAAAVCDQGDGLRLGEDACALICKSGQWVGVFPTEGSYVYEVPDSLPDLVALVSIVYGHARQTGSRIHEAFRQVVTEPDRYVIGRSLASV